jgi:hypothetical protein
MSFFALQKLASELCSVFLWIEMRARTASMAVLRVLFGHCSSHATRIAFAPRLQLPVP